MADGEGDIQVTRFADGLAIIERFEDGEQAGVFLQGAGDGVEMAGALVGGQGGPGGEGGLRGGNGFGDGGGIGIDTVGEQGAAAGAMGGEGIGAFGEAPLAADEEAEVALAGSEPFLSDGVRFGGGAVG